MKLPKFLGGKEEVKKEKSELEKLEDERKLQEAKLRNAEVSDEVIIATKVNTLFQTLRKGCHSEEEFDRRLRHYAEQSDINVEYLRQEFSYKDGIRRLESLSEENVVKLEKMMKLGKEQKRMLGYKQ